MVFGDLIDCRSQLGHKENTMHAKSIVTKLLSALLPPRYCLWVPNIHAALGR